MKYLELLSNQYKSMEAVSSKIISLNARRSLPKGTEYFFSDLHGEYESFLHLLRSASGMIRKKIDIIYGKTLSSDDREELASLIYRSDDYISDMVNNDTMNDEWRKLTIYRLIGVCKAVSAKYTRSAVRKKMPDKYRFILDEILNVTDDINKDLYYQEIIQTIVDTGIADKFIIALCKLIQSLAINKLHIIGDIFDRGPRADIIMNELINFKEVDIQWGNHDISWIGAVSGNRALICNVLRIAISYNSFDVLEDGYGLNLRALSTFAIEIYKDDPCTQFIPRRLDDNKYDTIDINLASKMHKAIAIIQFKLEGQLIKKHREYHMDSRNLLEKIDFQNGTITINNETYPLKDNIFPTIDPNNPLELTKEENELMNVLENSFKHSRLLNEHIKFLYTHGSMYKVSNGNLLYHGCIPMHENGDFLSFELDGEYFSGKALLDKLGTIVNKAYFSERGSKEHQKCSDLMWFLWCGEKSPLYGKDKMAAFERYFIDNEEVAKENYNPYFKLNENPEVCKKILLEFGLDSEKGHIINGHVPVKIKDGESPIKANGRLFIIDGGISKAYQSKTGIAGYTLIYDSHSLQLAEHKPFTKGSSEHTPKVMVVEKMEERVNISNTDEGKRIDERIKDLKLLLQAYKDGSIKEKE